MPNDGPTLACSTMWGGFTIHQKLQHLGMVSNLPELQYQPRFDKSSYYSRKGYAFGKKLRLKRKK